MMKPMGEIRLKPMGEIWLKYVYILQTAFSLIQRLKSC